MNRSFTSSKMISLFAIALTAAACRSTAGDAGDAAATTRSDAALATDAASEAAAPVVDAGPPAPKTEADLLEDYRDTMTAAVEAGHYAEVCKGTPWVNGTICNWVAARAAGAPIGRPDGELFRAFFNREHWKHAYGRIVDNAGDDGDYEVAVGGYRHHCILDTDETKFSTKGAFNMWVQEQPETQEVTVNSGATQDWVVLEEATLAKMLMDLAHAGGGLEATALAKNAMKEIAGYKPYSERKGQLPTIPGLAADGGR